jgi:hypothetical protein
MNPLELQVLAILSGLAEHGPRPLTQEPPPQLAGGLTPQPLSAVVFPRRSKRTEKARAPRRASAT